ncbi:MAG: phosphoribosyltransferase [Epsilonproteobacteria bacterium]|nr:phosphoribosyltransferase [Campylobacterota bacterium]
MKYYGYETFKEDTLSLLKKIGEFKATSIVCIARGGFTLSHAISEALDIRDVQTIRTELYDASAKRKEITLFGSCSFKPGSRVLVLDDIADSGETLMYVMNFLACEYKEIEFRSATLFYKKTSCYEPHYWVQEATEWIDFFWERDFK